MAEKQKELKSCHQCGLEAIDECQSENKHIPYGENLAPCRFCARNPNRPMWNQVTDFWDEMWTLDTDRSPLIEDPDPHERSLLELLHKMEELVHMVEGGEEIGKD